MLSGGSKLQDVNRLGQDDALKRVLGSDRIPHATTIGKFLWRFGDDQHDKQRQGLAELRDTTEAVQQEAFGMLPRERRKVATLDWDSSIHEVYGQKKEGRTLRTTIRGVTARYTGPWQRPAMCCIWGCGRLSAHQLRDQGSAAGNDRTGEQTLSAGADARRQRLLQPSVGEDMRAAGGGVLHRRQAAQEPMNAVREIPESHWKSFAGSDLQAPDRGRRRRRGRANLNAR